MDVRGEIDRLIRNYFYNLEPWSNINFLYVIITVITARKRSLGQGNVFYTCLSFCSQGRGCISQHAMEQGGGVYIPACNGARGGVYPACNGQGGVYPSMQWAKGRCVSQNAMRQGGVVWPGGVTGDVCVRGYTPHYGQQAGGMHPAGMLSCVLRIMFLQQQYDSGYCTMCPLRTQEWALHASWQGFHSTYIVHSMLRAPSISLVSIVPVAA